MSDNKTNTPNQPVSKTTKSSKSIQANLQATKADASRTSSTPETVPVRASNLPSNGGKMTATKSGPQGSRPANVLNPSRLSRIAADLEHLVNRPSPSPRPNDTLDSNSISPLLSTLAFGQLIASNRPTAGNLLIATELKQLNKTIQDESASMRKEIANLSNSLSATLKSISDEDNEARTPLNPFSRRPIYRRFSIYRRSPRRPFARKSVTNASTSTTEQTSKSASAPVQPRATSASSMSTEPPSSSSSSASSDIADARQHQASKQANATIKDTPTVGNAYKTLEMLFKNSFADAWVDSDSSDTPNSPNVSP